MTESDNPEFETADIQRYAALEDSAAAVEAERQRLAALLQGHIIEPLNLLLAQAHIYQQTLSAVPQAHMAISVLSSLAQQALQQARDLEANLHPAILETLGLEVALETLVSQHTRIYHVPITLHITRLPQRLPYPVELALFRAAQDILSQAIYNTPLSVRLACREDWVIFTLVGDDAFPSSEVTASQSLEHIQALGGTVEIENQTDGSPMLAIHFPLKAAVELTPREMEVIQRLAEGMSNKQIAHSLGVTARTVNFHLDNIYSKLGVSTRTEAAIYAIRQGWVTG